MLPCHVGIIMDGNGRWAKKRGLPRTVGHAESVSVVREVVRRSGERGIHFLTLYTFAKLNWRRPPDEVARLFDLLGEVIESEALELQEQNVRVRVLGDVAEIPNAAHTALQNLVARTADNTGLVLSLAINYDGRDAIATAATRASEARAGEPITTDSLAAALDSNELAPLDMIIRTGGEHRLSGFMTWESAYAEIFFTDTFWPDFSTAEYDRLIDTFGSRERRFGQTSEQLQHGDNGRSEDEATKEVTTVATPIEVVTPEAPTGAATGAPPPQISLDALRASDNAAIGAFCRQYGIRCAYYPFDRTRRHARAMLGNDSTASDRMHYALDGIRTLTALSFDLGLKTLILLTTDVFTAARGADYRAIFAKGLRRHFLADGQTLGFYTKYRPRILVAGAADAFGAGFGGADLDVLFNRARDGSAGNGERTLVFLHSRAAPADYLLVAATNGSSLGRIGPADIDATIERFYGGPVDPIDFSIFAGAPQEHVLPPLLWERSFRAVTPRSQIALTRDQLIQAIYTTALSRALTPDETPEHGLVEADRDLCLRLHELSMLN